MNQRGVTLERKCDELVILYNIELKIMKICWKWHMLWCFNVSWSKRMHLEIIPFSTNDLKCAKHMRSFVASILWLTHIAQHFSVILMYFSSTSIDGYVFFFLFELDLDPSEQYTSSRMAHSYSGLFKYFLAKCLL